MPHEHEHSVCKNDPVDLAPGSVDQIRDLGRRPLPEELRGGADGTRPELAEACGSANANDA
jgi:hypothetical protein